jgi:hypothetical protein
VPDGADEPRLDAVGSRINAEAGLRAMMAIDQATLTARLDAQDHLLRAPAVTQSEHGAQRAAQQRRRCPVRSRLSRRPSSRRSRQTPQSQAGPPRSVPNPDAPAGLPAPRSRPGRCGSVTVIAVWL